MVCCNGEMEQIPIYITGLGNVSPQPTTATGAFPAEWLFHETNQLKSLDPGYRDFIPADQIRRMGRVIRMGVASARMCLADGGQNGVPAMPDAIITGTGLGCIEDTEKFLASMIRNKEEFLTPTSFIQSTHNTVAGQIALQLGCHGYNFTYVHRGISFESALTDAMMQISTGQADRVLSGGTDELTAHSFAIMERFGAWKKLPVHTAGLLADLRRGTIAGEGAAFFLLEKEHRPGAYARIEAVDTFAGPVTGEEANRRIDRFLEAYGLRRSDIGLFLLGLNGNPSGDRVFREAILTSQADLPAGYFKHLCGEYHTASAFALWLGAMTLRHGEVPSVVLTDLSRKVPHPERILIWNHHMESNHALILLSRA